jgi:hypothetical protein
VRRWRCRQVWPDGARLGLCIGWNIDIEGRRDGIAQVLCARSSVVTFEGVV